MVGRTLPPMRTTKTKGPRRMPLFLKQWRKHRGLTQEQLAERVGITQGMISHLENDKSDYSGQLLAELAYALQCEPGDLVMRDPTDPEAPWSIWDTLKPATKKQAVEILHALKRASGE